MKILLTNDDGLRAPGIEALYDALANTHSEFAAPLAPTIWPCAPLTVQSATSHGVTFHQPLMVTDIDVNDRMTGVAVDGRPADCVKLAMSSLWPERFGENTKPNLVISGMNAGANVGINVIYSGTVAAALEAGFLGVPAIAVSLHLGNKPPLWRTAARHARDAIQKILDTGALLGDTCLSVNIPQCHDDGPTPDIRVCPMNTHGHADVFEKNASPTGDLYYWPATHGLDFRDSEPGADVEALFNKHITVTPLWRDLTDTTRLDQWRDMLGTT